MEKPTVTLSVSQKCLQPATLGDRANLKKYAVTHKSRDKTISRTALFLHPLLTGVSRKIVPISVLRGIEFGHDTLKPDYAVLKK